MSRYKRKSYGFYIDEETGESLNTDQIIKALESKITELEGKRVLLIKAARDCCEFEMKSELEDRISIYGN